MNGEPYTPRYDKRYLHFSQEISNVIGYKLVNMGIIDGLLSILHKDLEYHVTEFEN